MRLLGDEYVKSEFRAHRKVDNPIHIVSYTLAAPCISILEFHVANCCLNIWLFRLGF